MKKKRTLEELRQLEKVRKYSQVLGRIRIAIYQMRTDGLLNQFMTDMERDDCAMTDASFGSLSELSWDAEQLADERLANANLNLEQLVLYNEVLELRVARYVWRAHREHSLTIAALAATFTRYEENVGIEATRIRRYLAWIDRVKQVEAAAETSTANNELMALAWAIAHN